MKKIFILMMIMIGLSSVVRAQNVAMTSVASDVTSEVTLNVQDVTTLASIALSSITADEKVCQVINYISERYQIVVSEEVAKKIIAESPEKMCWVLGPDGDSYSVPCDQL